jgi:hypothetical protein
MLIRKLARQLRKRQMRLGKVPRATLDALSDDEIVDFYNTCSCCGEAILPGQLLQAAIRSALDAKDFFRISKQLARGPHQYRPEDDN